MLTHLNDITITYCYLIISMTHSNLKILYQTCVLVCLRNILFQVQCILSKRFVFLIFNCILVCVPTCKYVCVRAETVDHLGLGLQELMSLPVGTVTELAGNWTCVFLKSSKCPRLWRCLSSHMAYTIKHLLLKCFDVRSFESTCGYFLAVMTLLLLFSLLLRMLSCIQLPDCTVIVWFL